MTENTFDAYLYQLVENKQRFIIGQVMTSKSPVRSAEDIDETALSYAEAKDYLRYIDNAPLALKPKGAFLFVVLFFSTLSARNTV